MAFLLKFWLSHVGQRVVDFKDGFLLFACPKNKQKGQTAARGVYALSRSTTETSAMHLQGLPG